MEKIQGESYTIARYFPNIPSMVLIKRGVTREFANRYCTNPYARGLGWYAVCMETKDEPEGMKGHAL